MKHSVCFIGHRKINNTDELKHRLICVLSELIESGIVNFIFGDNSEFNDLCYKIVSDLKQKHPQIKRIKFRKDYEDADDYTMQFLLSGYEENICPKGVSNAGRASYIERNRFMINESDICVFYYDKDYLPSKRKNNRQNMNNHTLKSGTALAFHYAEKEGKTIINCFDSKNYCK